MRKRFICGNENPMTAFMRVRADTHPNCTRAAKTLAVCMGVADMPSVCTGVVETPPGRNRVLGNHTSVQKKQNVLSTA